MARLQTLGGVMKTNIRFISGLSAVAAVASVGSAVHAQSSATATGSGSASVVDPFSALKIADLAFGTIIKPSTGVATVAVDASGTRTLTGAVAVGAGVTAAQFAVLGQGGSAYSVSVPSTFNMTLGTNTLAVATVNNSGGGGTLSGGAGTYTTAAFGVGGTINLTPSTPSGAYTGNFTVTASYN